MAAVLRTAGDVLKRKYRWWQNTLALFAFALLLTIATFFNLTRPTYYHHLVTTKLAYYTKETADPAFQKAVASAQFKDGQLIYRGQKRIRRAKQFELGLNLTPGEVKKERPVAALVLTKKQIYLYAKKPGQKKYELEQISFPYDRHFNQHSPHLAAEIVKSWMSANTGAYQRSIIASWGIDFIYRILLVWLILILIIRTVIRRVNHQDESMVNLFGLMVNASLLPILVISVSGLFYFNPLVWVALLAGMLGLNTIIIWRKTKFTDRAPKIEGTK